MIKNPITTHDFNFLKTSLESYGASARDTSMSARVMFQPLYDGGTFRYEL